MLKTNFVLEPLKGRSEVLTDIVKQRFEEIALTTNVKNLNELKKNANYCIAPLTRYLPRAVIRAVKSNIIEALTGDGRIESNY